jgi:predicted  nucleic acid-binding Zn-ribbon protein
VTELEPLAVLQELDTRLDQLKHRREHLVERGTVDELNLERASISTADSVVAGQRHELEREQKRFEDEVSTIETKKQADTAKMYSMTSPKDLTAMQDEIGSLSRRQEVLEDQILELMEQIEPLASQSAVHDQRLQESEREVGRLEAAIAVAEAEIDAEAASAGGEREAVVPQVRADLLAKYDKLRGRTRDGVVIGRVADARCSACGLRFSSVFLDEIKHSARDELLQCDECGVLLVP